MYRRINPEDPKLDVDFSKYMSKELKIIPPPDGQEDAPVVARRDVTLAPYAPYLLHDNMCPEMWGPKTREMLQPFTAAYDAWREEVEGPRVLPQPPRPSSKLSSFAERLDKLLDESDHASSDGTLRGISHTRKEGQEGGKQEERGWQGWFKKLGVVGGFSGRQFLSPLLSFGICAFLCGMIGLIICLTCLCYEDALLRGTMWNIVFASSFLPESIFVLFPCIYAIHEMIKSYS